MKSLRKKRRLPSRKPLPRSSSTRIAITGGIAEGKSTVLQCLLEYCFSVCSSDDLARSLLANASLKEEIADRVGLPRDFAPPELRSKMLEFHALRRTVNRTLHPLIRQANREAVSDFYEVPLLVETCQWADYDEVWLVTCGRDEQVRRLIDRYGDVELVNRLLAVQLAANSKMAFADVVIRTNQPFGRVRSDLDSALLALKSRVDCSVA